MADAVRREVVKTDWEPIGEGESNRSTCGAKLRALAKWSEMKPYVIDAIEKAARGGSCWPLVFVGDTGSGKSCAAVCAVEKYGGHFHAFNVFCDELVQAGQERSFDHLGYHIYPNHIWHNWKTSKLPVVDDVGTRTKVSDHQFETLKRMLDTREMRPIIVTTNLQIEELSKVFDDRIASRLAGGTVIEFYRDRRLERET